MRRFGSLVVSLLLLGSVGGAYGQMFLSQEGALQLAFPEADEVERKTFFLTEDQKERTEGLARSALDSNLFTFFIGKRGENVLGYAAIDVHIVRTLPEAFLIVLGPDGQVKDTVLLAFYEPREYLPSDRWLEQFPGSDLSPDLRVGRKIHGIAGSTLTARAVTGAVRKVLALYQVLIQGGDD